MRVNFFNKHQPEVSSTAAPGNPAPMTIGSREGFGILKAEFELPPDSLFLKPEAKRALTICNLFTNHQIAVSQIAHLLEEDLGKVIQVLVHWGIIRDRRIKEVAWPLDVERRKPRLASEGPP